MANPRQSARRKDGRYVRTLATAEGDRDAAHLRGKGYTYQQIADELGLSGKGKAYEMVQRALRDVVKEAGEEALTIELVRLDGELVRLNNLEQAALEVMRRHHVTVSNGHVITLNDEPLADDGPVLAAIDRLVKIEDARRRNGERRAKLLGLDSPKRVEVLTIDAIDAHIADLTAQLALLDGEAGEAEGAQAPPG